MKKCYQIGLTILGLVAFFIGNTASAETIYQQLSDNTQQTNLAYTETLVGSFTVSSNTDILIPCLSTSTCSGIPYGLVLFQNTGASAGGLGVYIATSSNPSLVSTTAVSQWDFVTTNTDPTQIQFLAPYTMSTDNGATQYQSGITYYIFANSAIYGNIKESAGGNMSGFFTDNGGTSSTIIPNIPGYTNEGISTSSQAINCANNFSTSTSFLLQTQSDIAIGICNVGVFLFVPSLQTQLNFQAIMPALGAKFPFSWFQAVPETLSALNATNTQSFPTYTIGLGSLGIGSTTPMGNILPNLTFLSTTTISTYLPDNIRTTLIYLIGAGLWLGFIYEVYTTVRTRSFQHK